MEGRQRLRYARLTLPLGMLGHSPDRADEPEPLSELDETITRFEQRVAEGGDLTVNEQDQLRRFLPLTELPADLRQRVLKLLNPWEKPPIAIKEDLAASGYAVLWGNNYWRLPDRGLAMRGIRFDTVHGYYVQLEIKPLW
jgi:hypothetical protein